MNVDVHVNGASTEASGFTFIPEFDLVFRGFSSFLASSTSSVNSISWSYFLMERTPTGWVRRVHQTYGVSTSNIGFTGGAWSQPNAIYNIILKKGTEYGIFLSADSVDCRMLYTTRLPSISSYDDHYIKMVGWRQLNRSTNAVTTASLVTRGLGLFLGNAGAYSMLVTNAFNNLGVDAAFYDQERKKTVVSFRSRHEGQLVGDIYIGDIDVNGAVGRPGVDTGALELTRLTFNAEREIDTPAVAKDYNTGRVNLFMSGRFDQFTTTKEVYRRTLGFTQSVAKYFLSNDNSTWIEAKPGQTVNFPTVGNNIRLRAEWWAPDKGVSPVLRSYSIDEWNTTAGEVKATLITKQLPSTAPVTRATLNPNFAKRQGTVDYFLSNDGGENWTKVLPGEALDFVNTNSSDLRMKAVITVPAASHLSPVIFDYALTSTSLPSNRKVTNLEVNLMKMNFKLLAMQASTRYGMKNMIVDDFQDTEGIDETKSSGYEFDNTLKLVKVAPVDPVVTVDEETGEETVEVVEGTAIVTAIPEITTITPQTFLLVTKDNVNNGTIVYEVSRDGGQTWRVITPEQDVSLGGIGSGYEILVRATMTGDATLSAWSYSWL